MRAPGPPPELKVTLVKKNSGDGLQVSALANVMQTSSPVYYTYGHAPNAMVYNDMVAWEIYGPKPWDHEFIMPENRAKSVSPTATGGEVRVQFKVTQPGTYDLRVSTVDTDGRSTVVWKRISVPQSRKAP